MASLLQYCLQKRKTVSLKTVKSPSQFFHKDLRLTKKSHFWSSVHAILSKIEPKETRVDPKNTEKRPIYDIKLFCSTFLDLWAMPHMFPIYAPFHGHISALSLLEPSIWNSHKQFWTNKKLIEGLVFKTNFTSKTPFKIRF